MLYRLFMVAVIIIGIALIPIALLAIWFLLPWVLMIIGAGILIMLYLSQPLDRESNEWGLIIGFGAVGAGVGLANLQYG